MERVRAARAAQIEEEKIRQKKLRREENLKEIHSIIAQWWNNEDISEEELKPE